jgi:hypothetical protein
MDLLIVAVIEAIVRLGWLMFVAAVGFGFWKAGVFHAGQLGNAMDHWIWSSGARISDRDALIGADFVMARNRFSAAC